MRLLLTAWLLLATVSAWAEWTKIEETSNEGAVFTIYVDFSAAERNGDLVKMWDLAEYKQAQTWEGRKTYLSHKSQSEYDCRQKRQRDLAFMAFSGRMATGTVVASENMVQPWHPYSAYGIEGRLWRLACGEKKDPPKVELTKVDITMLKGIKADDISVYGVSLGMTRQAAGALLQRNRKVLVKPDPSNPTRLYVSIAGSDGSPEREVLYLIWNPADPKLAEIVVFEDFAPYLVGDTRRLLTLDSLDRKSEILRSFLGAPDRTKVVLDLPSAKLTNYYFDSKGLAITRKWFQVAPHDAISFTLRSDLLVQRDVQKESEQRHR